MTARNVGVLNAIYARHRQATRPEKHQLQDECCRITRYHPHARRAPAERLTSHVATAGAAGPTAPPALGRRSARP